MKSKTFPDIHAASPARLPSLATPQRPERSSWRMRPLLLSIGVALCAAVSAPAQTYSLTQINPPPGTDSSSVESVNNLGQVVGNTRVKAGRGNVPGPGFVWANGASVSLPSLGSDTAAQVNAISDSGLIVGYSPSLFFPDINRPRRAVWWQPAAGGGYDVGNWNDSLPEGSSLVLRDAVAISQDGQFVVFLAENTVTGRLQAIVGQVDAETGGLTTWTIETSGDPAVPLFNTDGTDIHYDGTTVRVVGYYTKSEADVAHAFLWQRAPLSGAMSMIELDSLNRYSFPEAVNSSAEVVGNIEIGDVYQAYFWDRFGAEHQLPTLGGARSYAVSINNAGYITGQSQRSGRNATAHAFLWHMNTGMRDLNALKSAGDTSGIELTNARKINNVGQILTHGVRKNAGVDVLLKPTP